MGVKAFVIMGTKDEAIAMQNTLGRMCLDRNINVMGCNFLDEIAYDYISLYVYIEHHSIALLDVYYHGEHNVDDLHDYRTSARNYQSIILDPTDFPMLLDLLS